MNDDAKEYVFYYPGPIWSDGDWIKNLLPFFDGIALLVPHYMNNRALESDPAIVSGLQQHDLLHIIEPETAVDSSATEKLATAMFDLITSGLLDDLAKNGTSFHELSMGRLGWYGDPQLAQTLHEGLKARGLARNSEDGVSIPVHPSIRRLILVLLSQILRAHGTQLGAVLSPATDKPLLVESLSEIFNLGSPPSQAAVVSFDLSVVGVDLGSVPIDEILDFRVQNGDELRRYRRALRKFTAELSSADADQRSDLFEERQLELDQLSADIRKRSRQAWRKPTSFAFSLMGAAAGIMVGNPLLAGLSAVSAILGYAPNSEPDLGAYSYLFRAKGIRH